MWAIAIVVTVNILCYCISPLKHTNKTVTLIAQNNQPGCAKLGYCGVKPRKPLLTLEPSRLQLAMIKSFKHKGLERFYNRGTTSGIQASHAKKLRLILSNLDQSESPDDMDLPGLKLHELKGLRKGIWSVSVSGNWRVTCRFNGRDAEIVDYEDYH